jgi:hypothetical protein
MMTSQTVTFGSRQTIFIVRVMQVLLPLFGFALMDGERNPLIWIGIIFAFTVWELFMFSMVFATLNEQGLAYLRWGKWKEATWAEISYGGPAMVGFIRIKLRGRSMLSRYLLLRNPTLPVDDGESFPSLAVRFREVLQPTSGRTN